jgi:hypothetical protein
MSTNPWFARATMVVALISGSLLAGSQRATAQTPAPQVVQQSMRVTMRVIGEQLGAKLNPEQPDELMVGGMLHGTLTDPEKLARLGIAGMHRGARITAMRTAPGKLNVEVDELEPAPVTKKQVLKIDERGQLSSMHS